MSDFSVRRALGTLRCPFFSAEGILDISGTKLVVVEMVHFNGVCLKIML